MKFKNEYLIQTVITPQPLQLRQTLINSWICDHLSPSKRTHLHRGWCDLTGIMHTHRARCRWDHNPRSFDTEKLQDHHLWTGDFIIKMNMEQLTKGCQIAIIIDKEHYRTTTAGSVNRLSMKKQPTHPGQICGCFFHAWNSEWCWSL